MAKKMYRVIDHRAPVSGTSIFIGGEGEARGSERSFGFIVRETNRSVMCEQEKDERERERE